MIKIYNTFYTISKQRDLWMQFRLQKRRKRVFPEGASIYNL